MRSEGTLIKGSPPVKVNDLHTVNTGRGKGSVQLEVDINSVRSAFAEVGGGGVDTNDAAGGRQDAFVHDHVAGRAEDRKVVDPAIGSDGDAEGGGELGGSDNARRLIPNAEEAVVNQFMIPAKVTGPGGRGCAASGFGLAHRCARGGGS